MAVDFFVKKGDRLAVLISDLKNADGTAVDLTGVTMPGGILFRFKLAAPGTMALKSTTGVVSIVGLTTAGRVQFAWGAADLDMAGRFYGEWEVTFSSGNKATFPTVAPLQIEVAEDLD